jgi:hypothetical protein
MNGLGPWGVGVGFFTSCYRVSAYTGTGVCGAGYIPHIYVKYDQAQCSFGCDQRVTDNTTHRRVSGTGPRELEWGRIFRGRQHIPFTMCY